ncbi:MAG: tRNA (adenosine(37)-N6)-threonylcarbamoyltransferase complex transferase subunit TsaD [Clostridia bacterium]|nr:tRNA (adenosine(37)-N6)-threonylcarbamoyltransferase complex transferase subunit TsaD [Clostridia bacterium]
MLILAIESSCDETAAAVLDMADDRRLVLSNIVSSQIETHALYGGVVPEIASRAHAEAVSGVVSEAVRAAGISLRNIEAVAVTFAPGLIGSLLVGVSFAKSLAYALGVPLIPVNHIRAHAAAAYPSNPDLTAPYLALIVSGGHTSLFDVRDYTDFSEIGSTRDDAAGEAFDKIGRVMGLPYPGGAAMDRLAAEGLRQKVTLKFPSPAIPDDTLDFSFSGLKTAVLNAIHTERQRLGLGDRDDLPDAFRAEVAAAFTRTVVDGVCLKLREALRRTNAKKLVLAGGVAANSHLRAGVEKTAAEAGAALYMPPKSLCGDNAVMVGAEAYYDFKAGITAGLDLNAFASDEGAEAAEKDFLARKI